MKAYKGFNKDMTCRGFQYEEGKSYETDEAELCKSGFHACLMPLNCLVYYGPENSVFHEVELDDVSDKCREDTKVCAEKIKIGARLSIAGIVSAQISSVFEKSKKESKILENRDYVATSEDNSSAAASGNWSSAATSGYKSSATTSGYGSSAATSGRISSAATSGHESVAATSGYGSSAAVSGDWSIAAASGDWSIAAASGYKSSATAFGCGGVAATSGVNSSATANNKNVVALACGNYARAKGVLGSFLALTEWDENGAEILCAKMERVDGEHIKADTWYILKDGEFKELEKYDLD